MALDRSVLANYSRPQRAVITHRGGHLQVVACAGSGKTETVSMRVAGLVAGGAAPASIVAFTFTNAAADALKSRIVRRIRQVLPAYELERLAPMFVGTIHSYCLRFLQERVPRFASYDLFEDHRLVGLLTREYQTLDLGRLNIQQRTRAVQEFLRTASVVENEMLRVAQLPKGVFRDIYSAYLDMLERYRVLTHNQCIGQAVRQLDDPEVFARYHAGLRHLIVDEFQDINPAQAALIRRLGTRPVEICVVGDDDQAIYQWRGSSVDYIVDFQRHYRARRHTLAVNRRSHRGIVELAARYARGIPGRLRKTFQAHRDEEPRCVQRFVAPTAAAEAALVADAIQAMQANGIPLTSIAILLRSVRTSGEAFFEALEARGIRYTAEGRDSLFHSRDVQLLARLYHHWAGRNSFWNAQSREPESTDLATITAELGRAFSLRPAERRALAAQLAQWDTALPAAREADLVGLYYRLLRLLGVHRWDPQDGAMSQRLGVLARFSELLADFESVTRRARRVDNGGQPAMRGGQAGGMHYLGRLADYIGYYAQNEYDGFDGEPEFGVEGVTITTIHKAKGLEWPVVFVPCLTKNRFPTTRTGREQDWLLPRTAFPAKRYEGTMADEQRLFYVAMTRARDYLYLSAHDAVTSKPAARSPFFEAVGGKDLEPQKGGLWVPRRLPSQAATEEERPTYSFSDLAAYAQCPQAYRFRTNLGFQPPAVKELGYGKAVHHLLRCLAEEVRRTDRIPTAAKVAALVEDEFYLPYADRPAYTLMRAKAERILQSYVRDYADDLTRVWELERSFELHLPNADIVGRADVILDRENGEPGALAFVDYKTKPSPAEDPLHALQLAIYASAARGEGLDVRAAYLHDLSAQRASARKTVPIDPATVARAQADASRYARGIREACFTARPGTHCSSCDVRLICRAAPASAVGVTRPLTRRGSRA